MKSPLFSVFLFTLVAMGLQWGLSPFLESVYSDLIRVTIGIAIVLLGIIFVLPKIASTIEETTDVLSRRTSIASGLLQALGTAFPDMLLGIIAAFISLRYVQTDPAMAVSFAIIAAASTFGSNIYNVGHAAWCVYRQNVADKLGTRVAMFPFLPGGIGGKLCPTSMHHVRPRRVALDKAITVLVALTILTAVVSMSMVLFGRVSNPAFDISGDLYQLVRPVGIVVALLSLGIMYMFRKDEEYEELHTSDVTREERFYDRFSTPLVIVVLFISAVAIVLAADSMINAVHTLSVLWHIPFVLSGVATGIIGCLGEMLVVHNLSVHPKGRIGDAIMGVGMDNIMTTLGASLVATMGGIFLGGSSLIIIFVLILTLNTLLLWQISLLKNSL